MYPGIYSAHSVPYVLADMSQEQSACYIGFIAFQYCKLRKTKLIFFVAGSSNYLSTTCDYMSYITKVRRQ